MSLVMNYVCVTDLTGLSFRIRADRIVSYGEVEHLSSVSSTATFVKMDDGNVVNVKETPSQIDTILCEFGCKVLGMVG